MRPESLRIPVLAASIAIALLAVVALFSGWATAERGHAEARTVRVERTDNVLVVDGMKLRLSRPLCGFRIAYSESLEELEAAGLGRVLSVQRLELLEDEGARTLYVAILAEAEAVPEPSAIGSSAELCGCVRPGEARGYRLSPSYRLFHRVSHRLSHRVSSVCVSVARVSVSWVPADQASDQALLVLVLIYDETTGWGYAYPADQALLVLIYDETAGRGYVYYLTGGSEATRCVSTSGWANPVVAIWSLHWNTKPLAYYGTVALYYG